MTLRFAAALAFLMGVATLVLYFQVLGKGPWADPAARHLRAMKDRATAPESTEGIELDALVQLPRHAPLPERVRLEGRGVVAEGYVQRILRAVDGDFHLDVTAQSPGARGAFHPYAVVEVTPAWHARFGPYDRMLQVLRPRLGGASGWDGGPTRVRLTGWLLYDEPHERRAPRRRYPNTLCAWEIHPVTRIEVWDETLGRFTEYAP